VLVSIARRSHRAGCGGCITRERGGRCNRRTTDAHLPLADPIAGGQNIGVLLDILAGKTVKAP
jgi:hypothetical protein